MNTIHQFDKIKIYKIFHLQEQNIFLPMCAQNIHKQPESLAKMAKPNKLKILEIIAKYIT